MVYGADSQSNQDSVSPRRGNQSHQRGRGRTTNNNAPAWVVDPYYNPLVEEGQGQPSSLKKTLADESSSGSSSSGGSSSSANKIIEKANRYLYGTQRSPSPLPPFSYSKVSATSNADRNEDVIPPNPNRYFNIVDNAMVGSSSTTRTTTPTLPPPPPPGQVQQTTTTTRDSSSGRGSPDTMVSTANPYYIQRAGSTPAATSKRIPRGRTSTRADPPRVQQQQQQTTSIPISTRRVNNDRPPMMNTHPHSLNTTASPVTTTTTTTTRTTMFPGENQQHDSSRPHYQQSTVEDDIDNAVFFRLREDSVFDDWINLSNSQVWDGVSPRHHRPSPPHYNNASSMLSETGSSRTPTSIPEYRYESPRYHQGSELYNKALSQIDNSRANRTTTTNPYLTNNRGRQQQPQHSPHRPLLHNPTDEDSAYSFNNSGRGSSSRNRQQQQPSSFQRHPDDDDDELDDVFKDIDNNMNDNLQQALMTTPSRSSSTAAAAPTPKTLPPLFNSARRRSTQYTTSTPPPPPFQSAQQQYDELNQNHKITSSPMTMNTSNPVGEVPSSNNKERGSLPHGAIPMNRQQYTRLHSRVPQEDDIIPTKSHLVANAEDDDDDDDDSDDDTPTSPLLPSMSRDEQEEPRSMPSHRDNNKSKVTTMSKRSFLRRPSLSPVRRGEGGGDRDKSISVLPPVPKSIMKHSKSSESGDPHILSQQDTAKRKSLPPLSPKDESPGSTKPITKNNEKTKNESRKSRQDAPRRWSLFGGHKGNTEEEPQTPPPPPPVAQKKVPSDEDNLDPQQEGNKHHREGTKTEQTDKDETDSPTSSTTNAKRSMENDDSSETGKQQGSRRRKSSMAVPSKLKQVKEEEEEDKENHDQNASPEPSSSSATSDSGTKTKQQSESEEAKDGGDEKKEYSPTFEKNRRRRVSFDTNVMERSAEIYPEEEKGGKNDDDSIDPLSGHGPARSSRHSTSSTSSHNELDISSSSHLESFHDESDHLSTSSMENDLHELVHTRRRGSMGSVAESDTQRTDHAETLPGNTSPKSKRGVLRKTGRLAKKVAMPTVRLAKNVTKIGRGGRGKAKQKAGVAESIRARLSTSIHGAVPFEELDTGHLTFDEYTHIEETLNKNLMFRELFDGALHSLVLAFERTEVEKGHVLIRQGEESDDWVYIVFEGEFSVAVDGVEVSGPFGTLGPMSLFGELGVVYHHSHAATISCKSEEAVVFRASNVAFTHAINIMPDDDNCDELDEDEVDMKAIDRAIDQLSGTKLLYGGEITKQYQPGRIWLWSQYHGTILEQNLRSTVISMLVSIGLIILVRYFADPTWEVGMVPDDEHPLIQHLSLYYGVWSFSVTLNTFVLTFYVNQAYTFWQSTIKLVRMIQGGLSDFMIALATHAKRNKDGNYTPQAEAIMDEVGSSARLFHALFWANCARRFYCLATPTGMATMAQRGMMTPKQLKILQSLKSPYATKHNACLEWMMISASMGIEEGHFRNPDALSRQLLETTCSLRGTTVKITDSLKSRMPLAYTHLVQILVDGFIWASPLALYPELGAYSVLCVGVITLFYGGLMDMAKIFLDPLDNQHFKKTSINMGMDIGVLTKESNSGSIHFKENGRKIPF